MGKLEGKVALITGAGRGQGRSHAIRLAGEGADIIATDICEPITGVPYEMASMTDLEETQRAVEALGRRIIVARNDVRDLGALTAVIADAVSVLGRLDIVSANAGVAGPFAAADDLTGNDWKTTVDINLNGAYNTVRAAIPHIKAGGRGGSIVLTSSVAGLKPLMNASNYVASKFGVKGLMKALALELAPLYIRVNSVHPTSVDTPMIQNQSLWEQFCPDKENPTKADFAASMSANAMPVPWIESIDVSNVVLFLASDDARFVTGAAIPVDAGCNLI